MTTGLTVSGEGKAAKTVRAVPTRPSQCAGYVRGRLTDSIKEIADGLVKEAAKGSCQHLKLASELLEKAKPKEREKKGSAQRLLEKWRGSGKEKGAEKNARARRVDGRFLGAVRD